MRKFEIGDTVAVIRKGYPNYKEYGCIIGFHNDNVLVRFNDNPYKAEHVKEYPEDSLKLVPSTRTCYDRFSKSTKKPNDIKKVIFSGNKTIILWNDGSKSMVSCAEGEQLDPYIGFCAAFTKGIFGSKHQVEKVVKNADYQPSKEAKKKISETLKKLREADTDKEEIPEFLKKKLIIDDKNSEFKVGDWVEVTEPDTDKEEADETLKKLRYDAHMLKGYVGIVKNLVLCPIGHKKPLLQVYFPNRPYLTENGECLMLQDSVKHLDKDLVRVIEKDILGKYIWSDKSVLDDCLGKILHKE